MTTQQTGIILLSARSIEILLDLVEMKIGQMEVADVEDSRAFKTLERCRAELKRVEGGTAAIRPGAAPAVHRGRPAGTSAPGRAAVAESRGERFAGSPPLTPANRAIYPDQRRA